MAAISGDGEGLVYARSDKTATKISYSLHKPTIESILIAGRGESMAERLENVNIGDDASGDKRDYDYR